MKLICNQRELSDSLSLVNRAISARPSHPILANVLLVADADANQITLTAFDLSLGIRTTIEAEVKKSGTIAMPAKLLNDIVVRLDGQITLTIKTKKEEGLENLIVELKTANGKYQIRGMESGDFPELPELDKTSPTIQVTAATLLEGLRGTLFTASSEETKQILTGVHLTVDEHKFEFATTDGHRLAVVETENVLNNNDKKEITIPAKGLRELERMLANTSGEQVVTLHFDEGQAIFEWEGQRLTSRTLDGQYPTYQQLIPRQFQREVIIEKRALVSVLERVAVFADSKNNVVKFSFDQGKQELILSVEAQDLGNAMEAIPVQITGDNIEVAFNVKYLMEGLKAIPAPELVMSINTSLTPVILTPLTGVKMTYLVMPIQLRN
jgi:DNA polymerase-3 subunit beta